MEMLQTRSIVPATATAEPVPALRHATWAQTRLWLDQVAYSIRCPKRPREVSCAHCSRQFRAMGPTGYADDDPICDLCLLQCEEDLGLVLALVTVARTYAAVPCDSDHDHWEALEELGAFVWIYDRAAARSGPVREFPLEPGS